VQGICVVHWYVLTFVESALAFAAGCFGDLALGLLCIAGMYASFHRQQLKHCWHPVSGWWIFFTLWFIECCLKLCRLRLFLAAADNTDRV
jgi:hypothetical protein